MKKIAYVGVDYHLNVLAIASLMKMSPLTALLKCPHYEKGHYRHESERKAKVSSPEDGIREKDNLKAGQ